MQCKARLKWREGESARSWWRIRTMLDRHHRTAESPSLGLRKWVLYFNRFKSCENATEFCDRCKQWPWTLDRDRKRILIYKRDCTLFCFLYWRHWMRCVGRLCSSLALCGLFLDPVLVGRVCSAQPVPELSWGRYWIVLRFVTRLPTISP